MSRLVTKSRSADMATTHHYDIITMPVCPTAGSATAPPIASCSFVFRVVSFIIDDLKKNHYDATHEAAGC